MFKLALWLAQVPTNIPDLAWWVLGGALTLLQLAILTAARFLWLYFDERLKRIERQMERLEAWQEDHAP